MSTASEVEARFDAAGGITVLSFTWRGAKWPATSQGRQWSADDGQHFLVMTTGDRILELVFAPSSGQWQIADTPRRPLSA